MLHTQGGCLNSRLEPVYRTLLWGLPLFSLFPSFNKIHGQSKHNFPHTGWFGRRGKYFGRWQDRPLWEKRVHMNVCLILIGYRDRAVWISRRNYVRFLFVGLDEGRSLLKADEYTRRTTCSRFGCCYQHSGTWRSTQTNNTRCSHTSCKVQWGWRRDLRTFIVNCDKFSICLLKKVV